MKRSIFGSLALLVAVAVTVAAVEFQRPDLASSIFPAVTVGSTRTVGATASTGTMVDLANYGSAMAVINIGHRVDTAATRYAVLSDSAAGAATTLHDSVAMDSVDNSQYKVAYRGAKRWVRITIRGTGGTDTINVGALILRGNPRSR